MSPFVRPMAVRHADRLVARAVTLLLLAVYTATQVTQPDVIDGEVEYQTTSSLARDGTLALGGTPEAEALKRVESTLPDGSTRLGFDGRWGKEGREDEFFSWFGVGQAFVGLPFYAVGAVLADLFPRYEERNAATTHMGVQRSEYFQHLVVGWRNPLLGALTAGLVVLSSRRLGAGRRNAALAGLSYGLCTFAWPQARSTLNAVQTTFWAFLAFHLVLYFEESLDRARRPARTSLLLCGLALGGAFLTRSLTAPVILVVGLSAAVVLHRGYRPDRLKLALVDLAWIAAPAAACLGLFLWTNQARFGDALEQGYGGIVTWEGYFGYPIAYGLAGLLLSPGQGLLWMAPGALLAVFWLRTALRQRNWRLPLAIAGVALAVVVPVAMTSGWHGAWGYGPRYALPLLPFLWLGVGTTLEHWRDSPRARAVVHGLLLIGFVVALPGALVDTTTHTDLALEAAELEWPVIEGLEGPDADEERFHRIRWDPRFAAPAAHWRILRHRVAGLGDEFDAERLFFLELPEGRVHTIRPDHERELGFRHLAWVDFRERLGGPKWPLAALCTALTAAAALFGLRGLDPNRA